MVHPVFFSKIINTFRFQTYKKQKEEMSVDDVVAAYGQPNAVVGDHIIYHSANNPSVGLNFEIESNHVEKIVCGMLQ